MMRALSSNLVALMLLSVVPLIWPQSTSIHEFISFEESQPVLQSMARRLPPDLVNYETLSARDWTQWVQRQDAEFRGRLDRGEEDTLTNLLRFGVTFTKEYRIDDEYLLKYGQSSLVNAFAENRARDLIRAMTAPNPSEGIARMRRFLEDKGNSFTTPEQRDKIKAFLLVNLAMMRTDIIRYKSQPQERRQIFQDRGISLDTNLWPDFLIDRHLDAMMQQGLLQKGSVRRLAIVGPGLDFANKENGTDFYPLQTTQPFAVLDSLLRLGLANPSSVEIFTLDISPDVNFHIERARKLAQGGKPYTVQLAWDTAARQTPEYRAAFIQYWQRLGSTIGAPVPPIPVPPAAAPTTETRALKIRPDVVLRLTPLDANIVYQRIPFASGDGFDLIIGTNVFVYFSAFEQSLARRNMSLMLRPGGFVLSNDELPGTPADGLVDSYKTSQVFARNPDREEYMFTYQRRR